ncbi:MAG TPA: DEAD/DEAH box helicase, partial [Leptospiraceae bacterium]|nr:DEAD/DEAH box helicase [Leptospiraceae bacterium]
EGPAALILAPTRELVLQICEEAKKLLKKTDKKVATIIGGTGYKEQEKEISEKYDIVVATPGRLIDHIRSGGLKLGNIRFFILDEADRMFDMGFIKDVRYVMRQCPAEKQVMLFSATLSYYVVRLASDYLRDPVEIRIEPDKVVTENIDQKIVHLGRDEKMAFLINSILEDKEEGLGIIFTNLKVMIPELVSTLRRHGIPVTGISSTLDQKKRIRLLKDFKLGKYKYLIATDVASRGIDVDNIKVVYNYDLPMDTENYVHRIGRTARAGKTGRSVSFCSEKDYTELEKIEKMLGSKLESIHVEETYLQMPKGEFEPFVVPGERIQEFTPKDKRQKPDRKRNDRNFDKNKDRNRNNKDRKFKEKSFPVKKDLKESVDEAIDLIQKADTVLGKENTKKKPDKNSKKFQNAKVHKVTEKKAEISGSKDKSYDKSKRNLFDINDYRQEEPKKISLWQRLKSFFGL